MSEWEWRGKLNLHDLWAYKGHELLGFQIPKDEVNNSFKFARHATKVNKRKNQTYRHNGRPKIISRAIGDLGEKLFRSRLLDLEIPHQWDGRALDDNFGHDFIVGSTHLGCKTTQVKQLGSLFADWKDRGKWLYPAKRDPEVKKRRKTGYPEMLFCAAVSIMKGYRPYGWIIGILDVWDIWSAPMKIKGNEMAHWIPHEKIQDLQKYHDFLRKCSM